MPAVVAPLVAFALGVLFALQAKGDAERYDDAERRAALRIVALFSGLVLAPVTAYFVAFEGDWSLAYLADSRIIPSALGLVWVVFTAAVAPLGFEAGLRAVRRRARGELLALCAVPAAIAFLFVVALYPELRLEGTTAQVRGDFGTRPVAGGPLGWAILWMDGMVALGVALTVRALVPKRRRVPAPAPVVSPSTRPPASAPPPGEPAAAEPPRLLGQRRRRSGSPPA